LQAVTLLDGPFRAARERNTRYLLELDPDRLLHNFRVNAGLEPKAPVYGGWESQDPWNEIRCHGHTLGHWLSAGAQLYASTGDEQVRQRLDYIVSELKACQDAGGTGLVCAFPDGAQQLENAVRSERFVGVPWYTMHKVCAGLRDAYQYAGNATARTVLLGLSEWALRTTAPLTDEQFQRMLAREHGGMNEVLADVHALTGDARFLTLAQRFSHRALLDPLVAGTDPLDGLHANTQIPKVVGFHRLYQLTGDPQYLRAAHFFWHTIVPARSFVTGGHGDLEHFFPVREFPQRLQSAKTMETCCTYNMLRLTRMLFAGEPSPEYADYYELALLNGILASQDPDTGWNTYFQPTRPGYLKLYHTPVDSFWCCTGSGLENHAKYADSIYFEGDDALYVNLFIASEVQWRAKGITLRQTTSFPESEATRLAITAEQPVRTTLHVRVPGWAEGAALTVNGRPWQGTVAPRSFVALEREWRSGDVVELTLPMRLRTAPLPGDPARVAFVYGPVVLAGRLGRAGLFPGADILRNERTTGDILNVPVTVPTLAGTAESVRAHVRKEPDAPLSFRTDGIGRPQDVALIPYYRLHHERYNIYWQLSDQA
ncbi:MAG: glycosyl hydrolase, partial [Gemmatimonadetes bacterium]|nr:glycosyl hydrolase [Gemmatimonadota bacterium]